MPLKKILKLFSIMSIIAIASYFTTAWLLRATQPENLFKVVIRHSRAFEATKIPAYRLHNALTNFNCEKKPPPCTKKKLYSTLSPEVSELVVHAETSQLAENYQLQVSEKLLQEIILIAKSELLHIDDVNRIAPLTRERVKKIGNEKRKVELPTYVALAASFAIGSLLISRKMN